MSLESVNRVSKGPSRFAIAGERFAALTTARAVAASNKIFISDLIRVEDRRPARKHGPTSRGWKPPSGSLPTIYLS